MNGDSRTTRSRDIMVRRGPVSRFDAGVRPFPPAAGPIGLMARAALPVSSVACALTDDSVVAVTYDDGPDPAHTPGVLDALKRHGVQATFFVLLKRALRHPDILVRMQSEGHEIALHGYDHSRLSSLPPTVAIRRIWRARRGLEELTGQPVALFRPPWGAQSPGQLIGTRSMGMEVILWSAWSRDWEEAPAEDITALAVQALHPGAILLMHDAYGNPEQRSPAIDRPAVAEGLLLRMEERGYTTATVSELLRSHPVVRTYWATGPKRLF